MEVETEETPDRSTEQQNDKEQITIDEEPTTNNADSLCQLQRREINQSCLYTIKNKLVRIQYPGIVENLDKALETLGGMRAIEKAVYQTTNKLHLNFRPKNKFRKGCYADGDHNGGLLLKITQIGPFTECSYEIVGYTAINFTFNRMIDFQYLPLVAEHPETLNSKVNCMYESIIPKELPSFSDVLRDGSSKIPLFLIPSFFSRVDVPKKFNMNEKSQTTINNSEPPQVKKRMLKRCLAFQKHDPLSIFRKHSDIDVPQQPLETLNQIISKRHLDNEVIVLQKLFEEKPIWTKSGVMFVSSFSFEILKFLLPAVAYYMTTGPWRSTWVRFGYDPRTDPGARKYQTLDYRVPCTLRIQKFGAKRSKQILTSSSLDKLFESKSKKHRKNLIKENTYLLKPNMIPGARQIFYQYCNILLPEVQSMISKLPEVSSNAKCHPQLGWLPTNFVEQCREIITKYVEEAIYNQLINSNENVINETIKTTPRSTDYVSLMIKNAKRGLQSSFVKQEHPEQPSTSTNYSFLNEENVMEISDSESNNSEDEIDNFELINYEDQEDEEENMDIDVDALEDIKNLIKDTNLNKN